MIATKGYGGKLTTATIVYSIVDFLPEKSSKFTKNETETSVTYDNVVTLKFTNPNSADITVKIENQQGIELGRFTIYTGDDNQKSCRCRIAENNNILVLDFASAHDIGTFSKQIVMLKTKDQYFIAVKYSNNANPSKNEYALTDGLADVDTGIGGKQVINRLPYYRSENLVEILNKKIIVENTDIFEETSALFDCSNIAAKNLYTIKGKNYYAIDPNTLMEV